MDTKEPKRLVILVDYWTGKKRVVFANGGDCWVYTFDYKNNKYFWEWQTFPTIPQISTAGGLR